jgi:hypothetical protein
MAVGAVGTSARLAWTANTRTVAISIIAIMADLARSSARTRPSGRAAVVVSGCVKRWLDMVAVSGAEWVAADGQA